MALVVLTEAGTARLSEAEVTFVAHAGYLFEDRWSESEIDQLSTLLGRLVSGAPGNLT